MFVFALILFPNFIRALRINRADLAGYTMLAALLMLLGPLVLKKSRSLLIAGNYFLCIFAALLTYITVIRGGAAAYYAMNYVMIVLIAYLITNLRTGIFWGFACILSLATMKTAQNSGYQFAEVSATSAHINIIVILIIV